MVINPATAALVLQGIDMLTNAGAGYLESQQIRKAQRRADEENRKRTAYANLQNAFGGRAVPSLVNPQVRSSPTGNLLRTIGTTAGVGSTLIGANEAYKNAQAQNRLRDLQTQAATNQLEQQAGAQAQTAGGYVPIQVDEALRGTSGTFDTPIAGNSLLTPAFRAGAQQQRMDDLTQQAQLNLIKANADKARAAGGTSFSGGDRIRIAADAGRNVATLNPFLRGDEVEKLIVEQSGSMPPELLTSAVSGYNEQAAQLKDKFSSILNDAAKQAAKSNYEDGVNVLRTGLQVQGYDLSESMLYDFYDRISVASDVFNFSESEKKRLAQVTAIRENAMRAREVLKDDTAKKEIQKSFGRGEGAFARGSTYLFGEQETMGPKAANFLTQLGFLRDTVARYRSGAALTEEEQDFYEGLVGGIYTRPEQLDATLGELVNQMNKEILKIYEVEAITRGKGLF